MKRIIPLLLLALFATSPAFARGGHSGSSGTYKIGRDAGTGKFKPVKDAQQDKKGSVAETIKVPEKK